MFALNSRLLLLFVFLRTAETFLINSIPNTDGNLSCYANDRLNTSFRLCAIVEYTSTNDNSQHRNFKFGLWGSNAFRRFINERDCLGFTSSTDIGYGRCFNNVFEIRSNVSLCICATNECNENFDLCKRSVDESTSISTLNPLTRVLTTTIQCSNRTNISFTCPNHEFINRTACELHVRQFSHLCVIGGPTGSAALIADNYELYIDQMLYRLRPIDQSFFLNFTSTNVFIRKTNSLGIENDECLCIETSLCNENSTICAPQMIRSATTTTTTTTTITTTTTMSSKFVEHEKGLGASATAGIVCGIVIFTLIIIIEVILLRRF